MDRSIWTKQLADDVLSSDSDIEIAQAQPKTPAAALCCFEESGKPKQLNQLSKQEEERLAKQKFTKALLHQPNLSQKDIVKLHRKQQNINLELKALEERKCSNLKDVAHSLLEKEEKSHSRTKIKCTLKKRRASVQVEEKDVPSASGSARQLPIDINAVDASAVTRVEWWHNVQGDSRISTSPISVPSIGSDLIAPELSPWPSLEQIDDPWNETTNSTDTAVVLQLAVDGSLYQGSYTGRPSGFPEPEEVNTEKITESELEKYVNAPEFIPAQKSTTQRMQADVKALSAKVAFPISATRSSPKLFVSESIAVDASRSGSMLPAVIQASQQHAPLFVPTIRYPGTPHFAVPRIAYQSTFLPPSDAGSYAHHPQHSQGHLVVASSGGVLLHTVPAGNMVPVRMATPVRLLNATPVYLAPQGNWPAQPFVTQTQVQNGALCGDNTGRGIAHPSVAAVPMKYI